MNRFKLITLALPLAMSSAAFAADSAAGGSEMQHQAAGGKIEVTPGFTFGSIKQNYNTTATSNLTSGTDSMFNFTVGGEYGINEMIAVGLRLGYQSDSATFSPDQNTGKLNSSGMTDPVLYERTKLDLGAGSLHFGADLALGFSKHTFDDTANSMKQNEMSGGITFTPFVGWEMNVGPGIVGARLSYDLVQTDRKWQDKSAAGGGDLTVKNGNNLTFAAFWEMNFQPVIWGVDLGVRNQAATKTSLDAGGGPATSDNNGQTNIFVETYAAWEVAPDINILPKIGYGSLNVPADDNSKSTAGLYVQVAARFGF